MTNKKEGSIDAELKLKMDNVRWHIDHADECGYGEKTIRRLERELDELAKKICQDLEIPFRK